MYILISLYCQYNYFPYDRKKYKLFILNFHLQVTDIPNI
jgi:hypothetical protein